MRAFPVLMASSCLPLLGIPECSQPTEDPATEIVGTWTYQPSSTMSFTCSSYEPSEEDLEGLSISFEEGREFTLRSLYRDRCYVGYDFDGCQFTLAGFEGVCPNVVYLGDRYVESGNGYTITTVDETSFSYCEEPVLSYSGALTYTVDYEDASVPDVTCTMHVKATALKD